MNEPPPTVADGAGAPEPARQFWELWQRGGEPPCLARFLEGAGPQAPLGLAAILCVDLRERWRRGDRVPAEDYLRDFPGVRGDREAALDVAYCEFLLRDGLGESQTAAEYAARFPELEPELGRQIGVHRAFRPEESGRGAGPVAPGGAAAGPVAAPGWPDLPGYEVLGRLGQGGMGVVYKAWQVALRRTVAVKMLLPAAGDCAPALARFRVEGEAVARLQHAHIVQIHECGERDGRPYLVMEYADGGSLADKLDGTPWPAPEAARLAEVLARAVGYAHGRGVLHRDLKPGNVLLLADGTLKLSDFGLAKLLIGGGIVTETGTVAGTPSYMAPEQAAGRARDSGAAIDVYALGAILYELLTGRPPFKAATPLETLAQVLHADPVAPRQLQPNVPRDLETVCLKCLEKEPGRRYASADALAEDLRRFLAGEPIAARPVGPLRRLVKWARRKPAAAVAWGLGLATVLAASGIGLWLDRTARQEKAVRVLRRAEAARAVDKELTEATLLGGQAEQTPFGGGIRWAEALAAARRAETRLGAGEPDEELQARVGALLADLEAKANAAKEADSEAEKDRRMVERLDDVRLRQADLTGRDFGTGHADPDYTAAFQWYGLDVEALPPDEAAARIRARPIRQRLVEALDDWALLRREKKPADLEGCQRLMGVANRTDEDPWRLRDAVAGRDARALKALASEVNDATLPTYTLYLLGTTLRLEGELSSAVLVLLKGHQQRPGDFWINHNLGVYYGKMEPPQLDESIRFFTAALALRSRSASVHNNLGTALLRKGLADQALASFQEALRIEPNYAHARCNLGNALADKGEFDQALVAIRAAIALQKDFPNGYLNLGIVLSRKGQRQKAIAAYREAMRLQKDFAEAHYNLANALREEGLLDQAVAAYKEAIRCKSGYAAAYCDLGSLLLDGKKDSAGAVDNFRQALRINPGLALAHGNLGNAFLDRGELDQAIPAFREAIRFREDSPEAHIGLGMALEEKGQFAEALAAFERGDALRSKRSGWNYPSGKLVARCRRLLDLDRQRPAVLRGEIKPAAGEWIELAQLCLKYKRLSAAAARFYKEAFAAQQELIEQRRPNQRYAAACAAALAASGQGDDACGLEASERARWRSQALEWLRAELAYWGKQLDKNTPEVRAQVGEVLHHWQQDPDLAGLRAAALAPLPATEREACQQLWAAVEALRQRAGSK